MKKKNVIVVDVRTLEDARYFSARGADYLLYDMTEVDIDTIAEIQNWVVGPQTLLWYDLNQNPNVVAAFSQLKPAAICPKFNSEQSSHRIPNFNHFNSDVREDSLEIQLDQLRYTVDSPLDISNEGLLIELNHDKASDLDDYEVFDAVFDRIDELASQAD